MVCCISSFSLVAVGTTAFLGIDCSGSCVPSAWLMIFTSSPDAAGSDAAFSVASGGATVGFVITGFGAAGAERRVRFFRRVWALPSTRQKLTTRQTAMRNLIQLLILPGMFRLLFLGWLLRYPAIQMPASSCRMLHGFHDCPRRTVPKLNPPSHHFIQRILKEHSLEPDA